MSVNVENINKVIETIRGLRPAQFRMNHWSVAPDGGLPVSPAKLGHVCGTCGCIGGWTNAALRQRVRPDRYGSYVDTGERVAARALGLNKADGHALFFPSIDQDSWSAITRAQAIRVLEHLRDTGEVDWSKRGRR